MSDEKKDLKATTAEVANQMLEYMKPTGDSNTEFSITQADTFKMLSGLGVTEETERHRAEVDGILLNASNTALGVKMKEAIVEKKNAGEDPTELQVSVRRSHPKATVKDTMFAVRESNNPRDGSKITSYARQAHVEKISKSVGADQFKETADMIEKLLS